MQYKSFAQEDRQAVSSESSKGACEDTAGQQANAGVHEMLKKYEG